jgi:hypothetical protein
MAEISHIFFLQKWPEGAGGPVSRPRGDIFKMAVAAPVPADPAEWGHCERPPQQAGRSFAHNLRSLAGGTAHRSSHRLLVHVKTSGYCLFRFVNFSLTYLKSNFSILLSRDLTMRFIDNI